MSTVEELKQYEPEVLAEMLVQAEGELNALRSFRNDFAIATPAALYSGIRIGWAFLLCEPDCWLEISVSISENSVGQSQVFHEPEVLKATWGYQMSSHQKSMVDQYKTGIVVTHDNGIDVYPMVGTDRGNLRELNLDYTAGAVRDHHEIQRQQTAQKYLVCTMRENNDVKPFEPVRFCLGDAALARFIGQISLQPDFVGVVRVSMIDERGRVKPFYGDEECDLRTQTELGEFAAEFANGAKH